MINPNGAAWWRFKYQFEGREKLLWLGVHPHVSLQQARTLRDEAKKGVANGVDPSAKRQAEKSSTANSFEAVAREWLALQDKEAGAGHSATAYALKLAPLLFGRPGELRHAEWTEFDLDGPEPQWRIPAEKMKMGEQHLVPLSKQALALLRELQPVTGRGPYLFPSIGSRTRPMSDNTVNAALRRLGYTSDEMTGHGFRSLASTCLNEQGYHPDLIELQLAHAERNKVRAAYNKAHRLPERRKMMQAWSDYLDQLRDAAANTNVVPILAVARSGRVVSALVAGPPSYRG